MQPSVDNMKTWLVSAVSLAIVIAPGIALADTASVPPSCRAAIADRWPDWQLSPPPLDFAAYAKGRFETNVARGDFDDDGTGDTAVLLLTTADPPGQRLLVMCLTRGSRIEMHVVPDPYCSDGIMVTRKGSRAWDYERERRVTYRADGVHVVCFEKAGATYVLEKGQVTRVVDSD